MITRSARSAALAGLLLCAPVLVGCGSDEEPPFQRVAFCQGDPGENSEDGMLVVEWRQGSEVLATASGAVGTVFSAEVPIGGVQIYVDGVQMGAVNEGVDTDVPWVSPEPGEATYLATGDGCPERPLV